MKEQKLIQGVGINDVEKCEKHIRVIWANMLKRCYNFKCKEYQPTYKDCSVDPSWHKLSNFRTWFLQSIYKQGMQLDKDIINRGNKIYGPDNCSFVSRRINNLITDHGRARGEYKIGVCFDKLSGKFKTQYAVDGKHIHVGLFASEDEAFQAYKTFKEAHIKTVAEEEYQLGNCTKEVRDALFAWII